MAQPRRMSLQGALFNRETAIASVGGFQKSFASSRTMVKRLQKSLFLFSLLTFHSSLFTFLFPFPFPFPSFADLSLLAEKKKKKFSKKREFSLEGHNGCVNSVAWNQEGDLIISGSDDHMIKIWDPFERRELQSLSSGHQANIFSARFLTSSGNEKIISCDAAGEVRFLRRQRPSLPLPFTCNEGITFEVVPDPDSPHVFFSCAQDGSVRQYDLRQKESCRCQHCRDDVILELSSTQEIGVASMTFHPLNPAIFSLGCWDSSIRSYDRRMLLPGTPPSHFYALTPSFLRSPRPRRIFRDEFMFKTTSLRYNHDGTELLVSYSNDHVYLIHPNAPPDLSQFIYRPSDGPQTRHGTRVTTRGGWADTGPDAGLNEEGVNPTIARLSQLFQRFIEMQVQSSAQEDEEEEGSAANQQGFSGQKAGNEALGDKDIITCYKGHRNSHTMIKEAGFFGTRSEFVMSGSDDGRIFFWDTKTGELVNYVIGDKHVVNCLQPHPTLPLLATSGIDYDIKLWAPTRDEPNPMEDKESVLSRNRSFLAQGEPLVIPASLLFQFLANTSGN